MTMRPLNRWAPLLPVTAMQTFSISTPLDTHYRKATCKEVDCEHYRKGWATTVIAGSDDERILRRAGRKFDIDDREGYGKLEPGFIRFIFYPGQKCFRGDSHRLSLEREPLHVVRSGDWRGNPTGRRRQLRADQWLESFQQGIADVKERKERG